VGKFRKDSRKTYWSAHVQDFKHGRSYFSLTKQFHAQDTRDMGVTRKRSADEARAGGSRPERTFPKKEYPKKEYTKKDGGDQKAKKTPLVSCLEFALTKHSLTRL
jgi:hypothetical protein